MAYPDVADEKIGSQTRRIIANLFNKQPRTADKRWVGGSGDIHNPSSLKKVSMSQNDTESFRLGYGPATNSAGQRNEP